MTERFYEEVKELLSRTETEEEVYDTMRAACGVCISCGGGCKANIFGEMVYDCIATMEADEQLDKLKREKRNEQYIDDRFVERVAVVVANKRNLEHECARENNWNKPTSKRLIKKLYISNVRENKKKVVPEVFDKPPYIVGFEFSTDIEDLQAKRQNKLVF